MGIESIDLIKFNEEYINDVSAIICLESIVRLKNPHEIFRGLEKKYCDASFIVTAPSDQRSVLIPFNYCNFARPPNHMTKWSKSSLGNLFNTTNISCKVLYINFNPIKIPNFFKFLLKLIYRIIGEGVYSYVVVKK